ncbi:MAG: hypothetical protein IPH31_22380 [Lewinellaceae bacterium]|nr:hypothetical protein [Lewinellaceae bacterium]
MKAVIHTQQSQLFHNAPGDFFRCRQAGNYTITVEDGKKLPSLLHHGYDRLVPADRHCHLSFPDTIAPPSTTTFVYR